MYSAENGRKRPLSGSSGQRITSFEGDNAIEKWLFTILTFVLLAAGAVSMAEERRGGGHFRDRHKNNFNVVRVIIDRILAGQF